MGNARLKYGGYLAQWPPTHKEEFERHFLDYQIHDVIYFGWSEFLRHYKNAGIDKSRVHLYLLLGGSRPVTIYIYVGCTAIFGYFGISAYIYFFCGSGNHKVFNYDRVLGFLLWPALIPLAIIKALIIWLRTKE